jgi:transposase InsO family protein
VNRLAKYSFILRSNPRETLILTNHKNLRHWNTLRTNKTRHYNWYETLTTHRIYIEHIKGSQNRIVDTLSRPIERSKKTTETESERSNIKRKLLEILAKKSTDTQSLLIEYQELNFKIIKEEHESTENIHPGWKELAWILKGKNYHVSKMTTKIKEICRCCIRCQQFKSFKGKPNGKHMNIEIPDDVGEDLSVDICGPINIAGSKRKYLTVFINRLSRMILAFTAKQSPDVETMLRQLKYIQQTEKINIKRILSDRGTQIYSNFWKDQRAALSIRRSMACTHHARGDRIAKRAIQSVINKIRLINTDERKWYTLVRKVVERLNNTVRKGTRYKEIQRTN